MLGTSQSGFTETLHGQDCPLAFTVMKPSDGALTKFKGDGLEVTENMQALVLDCWIATVWPAISSVAFFTPPEPLPAAVTVTVALPVPLEGETESQPGPFSKDAVQAQVEVLALRVRVALPPLAMNKRLVGATVNEQALLAASETGIVWPATVILPTRFCVPELGTAVARTVPLPVPLVGLNESQLRLEDAVHAHVG